MTWEDCGRLNEDAAKTNDQYLHPGDNDFDMEQEFYDRHPNAPHHDDLVSERVNALGVQQTAHRRKGKAPVRNR